MVAGYFHPDTRSYVLSMLNPPADYTNFAKFHSAALLHITTVLCMLQFWTIVLVVMYLRFKNSDDEYKGDATEEETEEFLIMQHPSYSTYDDNDVEETLPRSYA